MKKNQKKSLTKIIVTGLTSTVAVVPVATSISYAVNKHTYVFDGKNFSSINSAIDYVKNNSSKTSIEGFDSKWELKFNNQTKKFDTPEELRKYVESNFITSKQYVTSVELNNYKNESSILGLNDNSFWQNIYETNSNDVVSQNLTKTIYQGKDDKAYENDINKAIDSYFEVHDAYYFNNIYFNNSTDLKNYLVSNYLPTNKTKANTIVLKGPNNTVSAPINLNDKDSALMYINSFIANNAQKVLQYTNSKTQKQYNINPNNVNQMVNNVNLSDLSYVHMQSNQGQTRYVIDNTDSANLIGPYFYNGTLDVGAFMNKKMWKKVNKVTDSVYVESKVDSMIGTFFSSIITDDKSLTQYEANEANKDPVLFRTGIKKIDLSSNNQQSKQTSESTEEETTIDEWFLQKLGEWSQPLKNEVVNANVQLMSGNKYNTFYKIPILYSFLMQRIVSYGLDQKVIDLVNYYFSAVCNYIQDAIETVVIDDSLLIGNNNKKFDTKTFFNIGNPEYDLNTSVEYYLNEIKQYPKLIAAMDTYMAAYNNIVMTSGLIPFTSVDQSYLVDFKILTEQQLNDIKLKLSTIYLTFSQTNYQNMLATFVPNSTIAKIQEIAKLPSEQWDAKLDEATAKNTITSYGFILKNIGIQNSQHQTMAKVLINNEIRIYMESGTIMNGGYLEKLYSNNPNLNKLDLFVKFVLDNPSLDAYKAYLVFLLDLRMNKNQITNSSTTDITQFANALTNLIGFVFGTAFLVSDSVKSLYSTAKTRLSSRSHQINTDAIPQPETHPLWKVIEKSNITSSNSSQTFNSISRYDYADIDSNGSINSNGNSSGSSNNNSNPINKVPLKETNWDIYAMPETFKKVTNKPAGITITDFKTHFSFINDFDISLDLDKFPNGVIDGPIKVNLKPTQTPSVEIRNIKNAFFNNPDIKVNSGSSDQLIHLTTMNGVKNQKTRVTLLFPLDEMHAINNSQFPQRSNSLTFNKSDYSDLNFYDSLDNFDRNSRPSTPSIDIPTRPSTPELPDRPITSSEKVKVSFSSKFKSKISGSAIWGNAKSAWATAKDLFTKIGQIIGPILTTAFFGLQMFFFVFNLLQEERIQDFYEYTTADGTHFYWDGGLTVSRFMGLDVKQEVGIDSMKLIKPVEITLPQLEEYYYYNGIKYYDQTELKKDQLNYMFNNSYSKDQKNFKMMYTLQNSDDSFTNMQPSLEKLIESVLSDLNIYKDESGNVDLSKVNLESQYIQKASYSYQNGLIVDQNDIAGQAEQIIKTLRPTKIALLPEVNQQGKLTGKLKDFVLPGNYWQNNRVNTNNDPTMQYVIDNSANLMKNDTEFAIANSIEASAQSLQNLKNSFVNKVKPQINNKIILKNEFIQNENYSDMNGNWDVVNIYTVKTNSGFYNFASKEDALNYLYANLGFNKLENKQVAYTYKGIYIGSESNLKNWVIQNSQLKK